MGRFGGGPLYDAYSLGALKALDASAQLLDRIIVHGFGQPLQILPCRSHSKGVYVSSIELFY